MRFKLLGILFVVCLLAPIATTWTWYHYHKKRIRREVKHQLMADVDKSELVLLTFSIEDTSSKLSWKHAKEFGYQGSMYDIVETQIDGDSVSFWCWWDFKETKLNKQLANVLDEVLNQNPANNQKRQHLKQFYKSLYFVSYDASIGVNSGKKLLYNPYSNLYQSEKPSTPQPPPKAIV